MRVHLLVANPVLSFFLAIGCNSYHLAEKLEHAATNPAGKSSPCTTCRIFVTGNFYSGAAIGGIAGADAKCNGDPAKPPGNAYFKAMIVLGTTRRACSTGNCSGGESEHIDWVMRANTPYYRVDGTTLITTTNANGIWNTPLSIVAIRSPGNITWTGINLVNPGTEWQQLGTNTCGNWDSDAGGGQSGFADQTGNGALHDSIQSCAPPGGCLYCVEQ